MEKNKYANYLQANRAHRIADQKQKMTGLRLPTAAALAVGFLAITSEAEAGCHCWNTKSGEYSSYTKQTCASC